MAFYHSLSSRSVRLKSDRLSLAVHVRPSHSPDANLPPSAYTSSPGPVQPVQPASPAQRPRPLSSTASDTASDTAKYSYIHSYTHTYQGHQVKCSYTTGHFRPARPVSFRFVPSRSRLVSSRFFTATAEAALTHARSHPQERTIYSVHLLTFASASTSPCLPACPLPAPRADDAYQVDSRRLIVSFAWLVFVLSCLAT